MKNKCFSKNINTVVLKAKPFQRLYTFRRQVVTSTVDTPAAKVLAAVEKGYLFPAPAPLDGHSLFLALILSLSLLLFCHWCVCPSRDVGVIIPRFFQDVPRRFTF